MKINKLYAGIALASTLVLTGCGGDDGSSTVNNELNYTVFDPFTDVVNDEYKGAWGKLEYTISNSGVMETISTVVGSSPTAYQNSRSDDDELEYYAGKNAFAAVPEDFDSKFYTINFTDSDTFTLKVHSNNSTFNSTHDILTFDLTGVGKQPRNATTGIDTDLSYFPDGFSATFPSGSECYILLETPNQTFYTFSEDEDEGSMTIDKWLANQQEWYTVTNVVKENVGLNDELPAVRYTDADGDTIAAVRYNGLIYSATYNQEGIQEKESTDPDVSEIDCDTYNDVAADFLEAQIKATYSK